MCKFTYSKYNPRGIIFGGGLIHGRSFPLQKLVIERPGAYTRWGLSCLSEFYGMCSLCAKRNSFNPNKSHISHRRQTYHINLVDQTHIQRTRPRRKTVFFKTSLQINLLWLMRVAFVPSKSFWLNTITFGQI